MVELSTIMATPMQYKVLNNIVGYSQVRQDFANLFKSISRNWQVMTESHVLQSYAKLWSIDDIIYNIIIKEINTCYFPIATWCPLSDTIFFILGI